MYPLALTALLFSGPAPFKNAPSRECPSAAVTEPMDDKRLTAFLRRLDPEVIVRGPVRELVVEGVVLLVISDARANRMRIMTAVGDVADLDSERMQRMLQANFDAVLDARYAIARGKVWSAFIHPLSDLSEDLLASGLAQVVVAAKTYGTTYTSGALVFGGGDSEALHRKLYEKLREQSRSHI